MPPVPPSADATATAVAVDRTLTPPAPVVWPGAPTPLGASCDANGTNFAVWSNTASSMTLCLFDVDGIETKVRLPERTYDVWHGYLPGVRAGQRYALRADGEYRPDAGVFHEPTKLLLDPYARAIEGQFTDDPSVYPGSGTDSAAFVPRGVVIDDDFDWAGDRPPAVAWNDSVIYELHVKGFTRTLTGVPAELRGTYAGLAHPAAVNYLKELGVTAVELLPVHHFTREPAIQRRVLENYWGYNTLGFFAPHTEYSAAPITDGHLDGSGPVHEFKQMVAALHRAGIEVILDVVYNHSAEGPANGPVLNLRGLANHAYYRHAYANTGQYVDYTGCGNTVDSRVPASLAMIMDSLRYWITEMHVDGFRFDLATALARTRQDFSQFSSFLCAVHQDPVVSRVKLIAEPWDLGAGGYQVGNFPQLWSEWNGRYRDSVRDFWAHGADGVRDLAYRLTGSSDLYRDDGRQPWASVNFITAHDGFTLRDLVSYTFKHNEANGEHNQDGTDDNRAYNCGFEGDTDDPEVLTLRLRQARNLLTTLLLSTGVPMLTAGDERWRTQGGNNNAYCQDNTTSWIDWVDSPQARDLTALTQRLLALRRASPVLRRRDFFDGAVIRGTGGSKDAAWFDTYGTELDDGHWFDPHQRTLGMYIDGRGLRHRGEHFERLLDDSYLLVLHAGDDAGAFTLPAAPWASSYQVLVDTARVGGEPANSTALTAATNLSLLPRSAYLLRVGRVAS